MMAEHGARSAWRASINDPVLHDRDRRPTSERVKKATAAQVEAANPTDLVSTLWNVRLAAISSEYAFWADVDVLEDVGICINNLRNSFDPALRPSTFDAAAVLPQGNASRARARRDDQAVATSSTSMRPLLPLVLARRRWRSRGQRHA